MIYLDNAATTLQKPPAVAEAVFAAINGLGSCGRGVHELSLAAGRTVYQTRCLTAELFNCPYPEQVAFTANSTEALNIAIKGTLQSGDHVITTAADHNSVLRPLYELREQGVRLTILPLDALGNFAYTAMAQAVTPATKAIVCTHVSNVTGNIFDIQQIGRIARQHKLLFILDVSQSAGLLPVDMEASNIDIVCFTGHKSLYGPQGTGGLCVRHGVVVRPLLSGGSGIKTFSQQQPSVMPERLEAGTLNVHGLAGLKAGLEYIRSQGIARLQEHQQKLMWQFYNGIKNIDRLKIYGDFSKADRAAVVAINLADEDSGRVSDELAQRYGICTRAGGHCAPLLHQSFDTVRQGMVRFSFSSFNTEQEVMLAAQAVRALAEE